MFEVGDGGRESSVKLHDTTFPAIIHETSEYSSPNILEHFTVYTTTCTSLSREYAHRLKIQVVT
jgi:hypothetical protein